MRGIFGRFAATVMALAAGLIVAPQTPSCAQGIPAIDRCLGRGAGSNGLTRDYAQWTRLEDEHRWREAAKLGLSVAAKGTQCVTGAPWSSQLAGYMIVPLQWAVLAGIDAFRSGDIRTLRGIGTQYVPIANRYKAGDTDDFDAAAYKHALLYLTDFRDGRCSFDLCTNKQYP